MFSSYRNFVKCEKGAKNDRLAMNIHEFQAKKILKQFGIPIPEFFVISSVEELKQLIEKHHLQQAVLKVQIHAGGRGKAGGVKFARTPEEILKAAQELLGKRIVNTQTGIHGMPVHQILVSAPIEISQEYYLGITIDRQHKRSTLIASPAGGMDIEQIAHLSPGKVLKLPIPRTGHFRPYHLLRIAKFMGWNGSLAEQGMQLITNLVKAFTSTDALLLEINPLIKTPDNQLWALDAKLVADDNALFRQPEIHQFFDATQIPPEEARAHQEELAYVSLDGNIGCMVNGAGLAMATMDLIEHHGGKPANFLDVGGGATKEKVAEGFKIILSDPKVKAVLVNIFGGIMNCETLAEGIIAAANELRIHVPLVIRMEGTNVKKGRALLKESGLNIIVADQLTDAAEKVVNAARRISHVDSR